MIVKAIVKAIVSPSQSYTDIWHTSVSTIVPSYSSLLVLFIIILYICTCRFDAKQTSTCNSWDEGCC